ncbi:radical SAM protein [Candidatus Magnetaquicoccus inordinatus]|uniref:radical SAM protein n=1 Tax=Candidatus Magnetaquicoccus inordinatus TaxID=2496818 RepID=UPI00102AE05D|nr:radical SAM protein [Candidatus Magnetaquicoccus inordinatus]
MTDQYMMDGHKMIWHPERVAAWMKGEPIAPLHIDTGLSKGCNIRCEYCFGALQRNSFTKGKDLVFPREALLNFMRDSGKAGVRSMALIGEAEPLLNPAVYEAIVVGTEAGVDMAVGTNGILLDTGRDGEMALEHLKWIRFNISAASAESYLKIHSSKDFAKAISNIRFCTETKARKGLPVTVGLQMVLTPNNVNQVVPLAQLGKELGVDYLVVKQCSDMVENELGIFEQLGVYSSFESLLKAAEAESAGSYRVIVKWGKIMNQGRRNYDQCLGVPFLLYVSGDGRVYPCGGFFDKEEEKYRMGDLKESSFIDIIASARYREVIELVKQIDVHSQCYTNCRTHAVNDFVWQLTHPPQHVNFV